MWSSPEDDGYRPVAMSAAHHSDLGEIIVEHAHAPPVQPISSKDDNNLNVVDIGEEDEDIADALFAGIVDDDSQPPTSRWELWSYYLYYGGDNGVGPLSYAPYIPQYLGSLAGYIIDSNGNKVSCDGDAENCRLPWAGGEKMLSSVILVGNGLALLLQALVFIFIGSIGDFGRNSRIILWIFTVINWGVTFGMIPLKHSNQWTTAFGLNIINVFSYGATLVFYAAVFPRLAAHQPNVRQARDDYKNGIISEEEYNAKFDLEKSHVSSISTTWSNIGYVVTLCLNLAAILPMDNSNFSNNVCLGITQGIWVIMAIPWAFFERDRVGPRLPAGESYFTIGLKQVYYAVKECRKIPYTFLYLLSYFFLCDGLNTTGSLIGIVSNDINNFNVKVNTLLGLAQAISSCIGTLGFWYIQRYFKLKSKTMFQISNFFTFAMPFYCMFGRWTHRVGMHNVWELWFYNVYFGLFQAAFYAYAQTCMADLTPAGYEMMFFGLYGIMNKSSSWIGPFVTSAITDDTGNSWAGFPFVWALCLVAWIMLFFVDMEKGQKDCIAYSNAKKEAKMRKFAAQQAAAVKVQAIEGDE